MIRPLILPSGNAVLALARQPKIDLLTNEYRGWNV